MRSTTIFAVKDAMLSPKGADSRQEPGHDFPGNVRQSIIAALEAERQSGVAKAEQVKYDRVQVVDVHAVGDRREAEFVGFADRDTRLDSSTGQPHGHRIDVVITADGIPDFAHGRSAEFTPPDHQSVLEEAPAFQVFDQGCARPVNIAANGVEVVRQGLAGEAMVIPVRVIKLNEPHPPLDQPARSKQLLANDGLPGSAPYKFKVWVVFEPRSISSGALDCIRNATS